MVATLYLLWARITNKTNFSVCEMTLLHFLVEIKEIAIGGTTSGILYNFLPKVIITLWCLDSYTHDDYTNMVVLQAHQKLQGEKYHTIPHLWKSWCCRADDTVGWHKDLFFGEASCWGKDMNLSYSSIFQSCLAKER